MTFSYYFKFLLHTLYSELPEKPFFRKFAQFLNLYISPKKDILFKVHNRKMYANKIDTLWMMFLWKFYLLEGFETKLINKLIKKNMVIIDIGANIGYYTLIFSDLAGKNGKVYAFEPEENNYRLLLKNIKANRCNNVIPIQKAVTNKNDKIKFFLSNINSGSNSVYDIYNEKNVVNIGSIALDKFIKEKIKIDIIKMDIEGGEFSAILGMDSLIKNNRDLIIICEFWPVALRRCKSSPIRLLRKMEDYGFKIKYINEIKERIEPIESSSLMSICNGNKYVNLILKR